MRDHKFHIALLLIDCHIPQAQSLKDKRMVVKGLKDRIRHKFNVSVAELDGYDKWQSVSLGFTAIGNERKNLDQTLQFILNCVESFGQLQICEHHIEFM